MSEDERKAAALIRLRVELYGAAQILKGDHLVEFKQLIREIAQVLGIGPIGPIGGAA